MAPRRLGLKPRAGDGPGCARGYGRKTANMCFHLIPDLKVVHQGGVVFSQSIVVTERGHEPLTDFPQEIFFR